jgi:branched-chain amino acid transport system permease protein
MSGPRDAPAGAMRAMRALGLAFLAALSLGVPLVFNSPSHQNFLILVVLLAQSGVAWNIVGGYAGQVSLGHAAFFGIGAYASSLLLIRYGINPWLGMLCGGPDRVHQLGVCRSRGRTDIAHGSGGLGAFRL